jgi:hypothetical protein
MIKSARRGCTGHEAHLRETKSAYKFSVGKPENRGPLGRVIYLSGS